MYQRFRDVKFSFIYPCRLILKFCSVCSKYLPLPCTHGLISACRWSRDASMTHFQCCDKRSADAAVAKYHIQIIKFSISQWLHMVSTVYCVCPIICCLYFSFVCPCFLTLATEDSLFCNVMHVRLLCASF